MSYIVYEVEVYDNGDRYWSNKDKQLHREDGPAVEFASGYKAWYINGLYHREDGPAIENANGTKAWYLKDINYTEEEFNQIMNPASCNNKEVEIDGKTYILKEKE